MFKENFINPYIGSQNESEDADVLVRKPEQSTEEKIEEQLRENAVINNIVKPDSEITSHNGKKFQDYLKESIQREGPPLNSKQIRQLELLIKYLELPYITDSFGVTDADQHERREWRKGLYNTNPDAWKLYESNKLRVNNLAPVVQMIKSNFANNPKIQAIVEEIDNLGFGEYRDLPIEKKYELIGRIDEAAKEILIENLA